MPGAHHCRGNFKDWVKTRLTGFKRVISLLLLLLLLLLEPPTIYVQMQALKAARHEEKRRENWTPYILAVTHWKAD